MTGWRASPTSRSAVRCDARFARRRRHGAGPRPQQHRLPGPGGNRRLPGGCLYRPDGAHTEPRWRCDSVSALFAFVRFELVRLLRSWKFLAITVGFPVVFYMLFLGERRSGRDNRRHRALERLPHGLHVHVRRARRRAQCRWKPSGHGTLHRLGPPTQGHADARMVLCGDQGDGVHVGRAAGVDSGRTGRIHLRRRTARNRSVDRAHRACCGSRRSRSRCWACSWGSWSTPRPRTRW